MPGELNLRNTRDGADISRIDHLYVPGCGLLVQHQRERRYHLVLLDDNHNIVDGSFPVPRVIATFYERSGFVSSS
jgi:hypothetical protein